MWPDRSANHHEDPIAAALGGVARTARACLHIANYAVSSVGAAHVGTRPTVLRLNCVQKTSGAFPGRLAWQGRPCANLKIAEPQTRFQSLDPRPTALSPEERYVRLLNTDRNSY